MEDLIKNNTGLIKTILNDNKISKQVLSNMIKIYKLRDDFNSIKFLFDWKELRWEADIFLKNRIESPNDFYKYLQKNEIPEEQVCIGNTYLPDYSLTIGSERESSLRCKFYNPKQ